MFGLFAHLWASMWVIQMLTLVMIMEAIAIISAIVALVFARSAALACRSAAAALRSAAVDARAASVAAARASSICEELVASLRCSDSRSFSDSHEEARKTNAGGIRP